jgi:hypothetical protein
LAARDPRVADRLSPAADAFARSTSSAQVGATDSGDFTPYLTVKVRLDEMSASVERAVAFEVGKALQALSPRPGGRGAAMMIINRVERTATGWRARTTVGPRYQNAKVFGYLPRHLQVWESRDGTIELVQEGPWEW